MKRQLESREEAAARLERGGLRLSERAQLWQRITVTTSSTSGDRGRSRARVLWLAAPAFALAVAVLWLQRAEQVAVPEIANECQLDSAASALRLPERCGSSVVNVEGDEWSLEGGAQVARIANGARVERGRVGFHVRHRERGNFRVQVSHGEVQVIGTRFVVEQQGDRGTVAVSEGVIEFVWRDGTRERVAAGQTLSWPRAAVASVTNAPSVPERVAPDRVDASTNEPANERMPSADLDAVMGRLLQLRSQKRFPEAVTLLRGTLAARGLGAIARERISYELGLAIEASGEASCEHWQRHVERFGSARHTNALTERLARCEPR